MAALSGMTGFGRAERSGEAGTAGVEARSVNGKGLDVRLRLGAGLDRLEPEIKARVKARFDRGSVSVNIAFAEPEGAQSFHIDHDRLAALAEAGRDLVAQGLADKPRLDGLLALKGVIVSETAAPDEEQLAAIETLVLGAVDEALDGLEAARREEGAALRGMLSDYVSEIEKLRDAAAKHAESQPDAIRDRVQAKFDALLPAGLDEDRLALEAAAIAVKADVREELDRLSAHIDSARALIAQGSPVGRKLDFLSQEFNREANTLCSKAASRELTDLGLALKAVIDQVREQVQNVE